MWKNWYGYVILQVEGLNLARFLRRLLANGIRVFRIRRIDETTATLGVLARDVRRLRPIRRRERCRIRILERHGLPFVWRRLCMRPVLLYGIPLCVCVLWIALARIWFIRIEGIVRTDPDEVMALLDEHGLSVGKRPKGSVLILAADDISARLKDAAWVSLNRDGVVLTVTVHESTLQHEGTDWSVPAHIVAKKDAVVVAVETKRGQPAANAGQTVRRGDVLISGHVVYSEDRTPYDTHADGRVTGACVYTADAELPTTVVVLEPSGSVETVHEILLCGRALWNGTPSFEQFRITSDETTQVASFGVPIAVRTVVVEELVEQERILTETERREQAELAATSDAMALVPHDAKICSIHTVMQTEDGAARVRCTIVTEEDIGISKEYQHE